MRRVQKRLLNKYKIQNSSHQALVGDFSIISLKTSRITAKQIECSRILLRREIRKKNATQKRVSFTIPVTSKPTGVRMGKGKGEIDFYVGKCYCFDPIFDFRGISLELGLKLLRKISYKLPMKVGLMDKQGNVYKS